MAKQTVYRPGWRSAKEKEDEEKRQGFSSSFNGATTATGTETKTMVVVLQTVAVQRRWRHVSWYENEALASINKW